MLARLLRSAVTFVSVLVAYQVYVLLAVPMIEPELSVVAPRPSTPDERAAARQSVDKYQRLLAAYFPADHWTQQRPPKVIQSGNGMLVLDEYEKGKGNRIDLNTCAVLLFPSPRQEGGAPPSDAVIIEAPSGASLTFNEEFNPARGKLGEITKGEFPGLVTIRSGMREPGTHDDLLIQVSDLRMTSKLLFSQSPVRFRLGPNVGEGENLEIRFLDDESGGSKRGEGLKFSGVQSVEIGKNVRLQLHLDAGKLLPGHEEEGEGQLPATGQAPTAPADNADESPLEVSSRGPCHLDLIRYVVSFDDDVEVWRLNRTGPSDQLSCQQLDVHFAPVDEAGRPTRRNPIDADNSEAHQRQRQDFRRLKPYLLVAEGFPVVMVSPSRQVEARGQRVRLNIPERTIVLDGDRDVRLSSGKNVLSAPSVLYTHPAKDAGTQIGTFHAAGAGSLNYAPNPNKPNEQLLAQWNDSVKLIRDNGKPVLVMAGRPRLSMPGRGDLVADEMHVFLLEELVADEQAGALAWGPPDQQSRKTAIRPDRMTARGSVVIDSPQLAGRTHQLALWFRRDQLAENSGQAGAATLASQGSAGQRPPGGPAAGRQDQGFALPTYGGGDESYAVQADLLRIEVALRGRRAVPTNLACEGNVVFREVPLPNTVGEPLVVHGQRLTVENLDQDGARVAVHGSRGSAAAPQSASRAEITARGVTLTSSSVWLDQAENRAWIDGAGEAKMQAKRDLQGRPTPGGYALDVSWRDGLRFDGHQVTIHGHVRVIGNEGDFLRCQQLTGILSRDIQFGKRVDTRSVDLARIDCQGDVVLDHKTRDAAGQTSQERMELRQLAIDQNTGDISGTGPGWLQSVHYGEPMSAGTSSPAKPTSGARLHFLRVEFLRGLTGNLQRRTLTFQQRIRSVYGPVDSWQQKLNPLFPNALPPEAVALWCESLTVNEDPMAQPSATQVTPATGALGGLSGKFGPVEMLATGNVIIQGGADKQGRFTARAERASYDQLKDVFVLEGDTLTAATIAFQRRPGEPPGETAARKVTYTRTTGKVTAEDIRSVQFDTPPDAKYHPHPARRRQGIPPR